MKCWLTWILLFSFFATLNCVAPSAFAGSIVKTNGKKVFLQFSQDDSFTEGDLFTITNSDGKKLGLVLITKVKGFKAIGMLQKGKAPVGGSTEFKGIDKKAAKILAKKKKKVKRIEDEDSGEGDDEEVVTKNKRRWGGLMGYGMADQDVKDLQSGDAFSMTGSSMAFKGLYDYPIIDNLTLRGLGGAEIFSVSGNGPGTSTKIGTDVTYLVVDALIKWDFMNDSSSLYYLVGGMGLYYPLSKSSSAVDVDSLTSFAIGEVGAGMEFKLKTFSIPIEVSYYYFPTGDTVKTSVISLKTGIIF